jgi:CRP-like cAMP-binding protein
MTHEDVLGRSEFFASASPASLKTIAAAGRTLNLSRGDVLFNEGDTPAAMYMVLSGRIAIAISNRAVDTRESMLALMESGDLFGELGLLDDGERSAAARAIEPSSVLEIPYAIVKEQLTSNPNMLWGVTKLLAARLRVMDEVLADSVFLDVTGRTAKRLLELSGGANEFTLPVTQEELAGMVGASRERVNKAIASFIRLGWLQQSERRYQILDRAKLEARAT